MSLQVRLMHAAGDAQTLGAAMSHASLNMANALGAWLGGLVISAGFGYPAPSCVGAGLSVVGLLVFGLGCSSSVAGSRRSSPDEQLDVAAAQRTAGAGVSSASRS